MKFLIWPVVVCLLFCPIHLVLAQGRLGELRETVRDEPEQQDTRERSRSSCSEDDDDAGNILGQIIGAVLFAPFQSSSESRRESRVTHVTDADYQPLQFAAYPYPHGLDRYLFPQGNPGGDGRVRIEDRLDLKPWSVQVLLENGNDFSGLNRFNGHVQLDTTSGFGMYTSWNYLHERLLDDKTDDAVMGTINGTCAFTGQSLLVRLGLGARLFTSNGQTDAGINALVGFDLIAMPPWIYSGLIEFGTLGSAGVFHARASVGYVYGHAEIFAGYDYFHAGTDTNSTDIHGPMAGLRLWF